MFNRLTTYLPAPVQKILGLRPGGYFSTSIANPCCMVTRLSVIERDLQIDGVVLEISADHALFREACSYILNRTGETVSLLIDGTLYDGVIGQVGPRGYQIIFDEPLDDRVVQDCSLRHGLDPVIVL
jgi:hypothetical protein